MKSNNEIKFFFPNFHFRLLFSKTMSEAGVWRGVRTLPATPASGFWFPAQSWV